jgi:hypothetical protein
MLLSFVCLSLTLGLASAAPPKVSEQVTLTVLPAAPTLYVGDVLLLKITLHNRGKAALTLPGNFRVQSGSITAECGKPGGAAFERAALVGVVSCGVGGRFEVPAGESIVCYEQVFWNGPPRLGPVFSAPGKWQLRVLTKVGKETIASEPVTVSAVEPPERLKEALAEHSGAVGLALGGSIPTEEQAKELRAACNMLAASNAGRVVARSIVLEALRQAGPAKAREAALTAVRNYRDDLAPVAREYFDLLTAEVLYERKEYKAALKILDTSPEPSDKRDSLRYLSNFFEAERKSPSKSK